MGSAVPSLVGLLISILRRNLVLTYGIPPEFRGRRRPFIYLFKPPYYPIGLVPSLSGHAIAYRWRSLPRVRRHRASKPQGCSSNGYCLCITMDQLICASLSHTHYWYGVSMLKYPTYYIFPFEYRPHTSIARPQLLNLCRWANGIHGADHSAIWLSASLVTRTPTSAQSFATVRFGARMKITYVPK